MGWLKASNDLVGCSQKKAPRSEDPGALPVEAGGIEPPSRDNSNGGLYMLSRCFDLEPAGGHRQSTAGSSRLNLAGGSTAESASQPAFCGRRVAGYAACRGCLLS